MLVRFLFVFYLLFNLFKIALWPSVEKELSPVIFTCVVFILVPSFPVWCLGQDVEFDCIGSRSLPFIYFYSFPAVVFVRNNKPQVSYLPLCLNSFKTWFYVNFIFKIKHGTERASLSRVLH